MLRVNNMIGFGMRRRGGGGVTAIDMLVKDTLETASNASSYTISGADIGDADENRWVAVAFGTTGDAGAKTISAFTVAGDSADYTSTNVSASRLCGIGFFNITAGTTGDVVITFSGNVQGIAMQVFVFQSSAADPRHAINTYSGPSTTIDIVSGGGAIHALTGVNGLAGGVVWTGLTERAEVDVNTDDWAAVAGGELSAETGRTISTTGQGIATNVCISLTPN